MAASRLGTFSAGGLGFGVAFTLDDQFSQSATSINNSMSQLDRNFAGLSNSIAASKAQMMGGLKTMGAGIAILAPLYKGANIAGEMESMAISFEVMLGNADKATKMLADLRHYADVTPFSTDDIISGGKMLIAYGQSAEDIMPTLKRLGNVASGLNIPMNNMIEMYGRNLTQSKLTMRDIYQMEGWGIDIRGEIAKNMGVEKNAVRGLVEDSKVLVPHMVEAFKTMSEAGGRFNGMMERQSEGYLGLRDTAFSYFKQIFEAIGVMLLPVMKDVFKTFVTWSQGIIGIIKSPLGKWLVYITAGVGLLVTSMGLLRLVMGAVRYATASVALRFGGLTLSSVLATIATKGLSAGLRQVGIAAWTATGPFVIVGAVIFGLIALFKALQPQTERNAKATLFLAATGFILLGPLGAMFSMFLLVKKSLAAFQEVNSKDDLKGGAIGTLQKIGGFISGIVAVFQSYDSTTKQFKLDSELVKRMGLTGVLDAVLATATWLIRFYEMFKAFWEGVKEIFISLWNNGLKPIFVSIGEALEPFIQIFEDLGFSIGKTASSVSGWQTAGKVMAWVLKIAFIPLKTTLWLVNIAIKVLGKVLSWVIQGFKWLATAIIDFIKASWDFVSNVVEAVSWVLHKIWDGFLWVMDFLVSLPAKAFDAGVNFVNKLWEGIKSIWTNFTGWLEGAWNDVMSFVGLGGDGEISGTKTNIVSSMSGQQKVLLSDITRGSVGKSGTDRVIDAQKQLVARANSGDKTAQEAKKNIEQTYHITLEADGRNLGQTVLKNIADAANVVY